jgi:flavin-dependent dehydrogenase
LEPWTDRVEIHYSDKGEAYVTPVADRLVGVALLSETPASFGELLSDYPALRERIGDPVGRTFGSGPFPKWLTRRVHGRVLFVGDAAGFLDPLTGEGVQLGLAAARLAVDAIHSGSVQGYDRAWWRMTRAYWWLTSALLHVRRIKPLDRSLIPVANLAPGVFDSVLESLGGAGRLSLTGKGDYQTTILGGSSG